MIRPTLIGYQNTEITLNFGGSCKQEPFFEISRTPKKWRKSRKIMGYKKCSKNHNSVKNHLRDLWLVPFEREKLALSCYKFKKMYTPVQKWPDFLKQLKIDYRKLFFNPRSQTR